MAAYAAPVLDFGVGSIPNRARLGTAWRRTRGRIWRCPRRIRWRSRLQRRSYGRRTFFRWNALGRFACVLSRIQFRGRGSRGNRFSNCFGAFCGHPGLDSSSWGGGHFNVRRRGNQFSNCFGAFCGHNFNFNRGAGRWGRGWGLGWGWGYYDPSLWSSWDYDDYRFDRDYYRGFEMAREWNEQNIAETRMRQQEDSDREDDAYAHRSYSRQNAEAPRNDQQEANATPTLLIFRDQHQKEVTNYAIVGQTLWNFTPQRKEKIPLADLDLAATVKANDDRGVPFSVPSPQQGQ